MRVVSKDEVKAIELFQGVKGRILAVSERVMAVLVEIPAGKAVPRHKHMNEQLGICLKGEAQFISGSESKIVKEGLVYSISSNEEHEVRMLGSGAGVFLDIFSPPREDYLERAGLKR